MQVMKQMIGAIALCFAATMTPAQPARDVVQMVNALRAQNGLHALQISGQLEQAAEGHAADMARRGVLSHKGSNGSDPSRRAKRAGYKFCTVAENVAAGQESATEVMQAWANSAGHRRNMLKPKARDIAVVRGPNNTWVMMLAAKRGQC
jgi:uncharacterized protein YkwD